MMQLVAPYSATRPRALPVALIGRLTEHAERITCLPRGSLYGRTPSWEASHVRFCVMKVAHERGKSYCHIGRILGMDHSSVRHGVHRADDLEQDSEFHRQLLKLLRREAQS